MTATASRRPTTGTLLDDVPWGAVAKLGSSTPGRLRLISIGLAVACAIYGLSVFTIVARRGDDQAAYARRAAPIVLTAQRLHASLSAANAAASANFLKGGVETKDQQAAYTAALKSAHDDLSTLLGQIGDDGDTVDEARSIEASLASYTGLIERARANNRLGHPVGVAYLNAATRLLRNEMIPATETITKSTAVDLRAGYGSATGGEGALALFVVSLVVLGLIGVASIDVLRRTNRVLNVGLVGAGAAVLLLWFVAANAQAGQGQATIDARLRTYDPALLLTAASADMADIQADLSQALIRRGSADELLDRVGLTMGAVTNQFRQAVEAADDDVAIQQLAGEWNVLSQRVDGIVQLAADRQDDARTRLLEPDGTRGESASTAATAALLSDGVDRLVDDRVQTFVAAEADGADQLRTARLAAPLAMLFAVGVISLGLRRRISEYG